MEFIDENIKLTPVLDSITPYESRLPTFVLTIPRIILPEMNTHRKFGRNVGSSRAKPLKSILQKLKDHFYTPCFWGKNIPGMQAFEEIDNTQEAYKIWCDAKDAAIFHAEKLEKLGLHKQWVNRLLEPFQYIDYLVTSSDWKNFLTLRDHKDAQPEIQIVAVLIKEYLEKNEPTLIKWGNWHIPYILENEQSLPINTKLKISVARCARISYKTFDGETSNIEKDLQLYDKLVTSKPLHASPTEHQALASSSMIDTYNSYHIVNREFISNLDLEWIQYRKFIECGITVG